MLPSHTPAISTIMLATSCTAAQAEAAIATLAEAGWTSPPQPPRPPRRGLLPPSPVPEACSRRTPMAPVAAILAPVERRQASAARLIAARSGA
jgi:hypothetical protein